MTLAVRYIDDVSAAWPGATIVFKGVAVIVAGTRFVFCFPRRVKGIAMKRCLLLCATFALASTAYADDGAGKVPDGPCKADVEKLCPGVQLGGGRIAACLKEHRSEVSEACKANLKKMRGHRGDGAGAAGDGS